MSNFNFNFSVGARVYYPEVSNKVLTLKESLSPEYPLETNWTDLSGDLNGDSFTENGRRSIFSLNPCIFPATQEWYERLVVIYPDLEPPPKRKEPRDIIQAMLDSGYNEVLAYVSDEPIEQILQKHKIALIYYIDSDGRFVASGDFEYDYAVPYCHKAGKKIIDFIDGEVVLESENE